jgi:lipoyl(octanoyl) transferase
MVSMLQRVDLGEVGYPDVIGRLAGWLAERQADTEGDRLFLLSHPPVITYGARTAAEDLPAELGIPTVQVDRGGYATYHGPGQLVGYLVVVTMVSLSQLAAESHTPTPTDAEVRDAVATALTY